MKKLIGLLCVVSFGIVGYVEAGYVDVNCGDYAASGYLQSHGFSINGCESHSGGDYADVFLERSGNSYVVTHYVSDFPTGSYSGVDTASILWCSGTAYGRTSTQEYSLVTKKKCCSEGNRVDDSGNCIVDCTNGTYYGKNQDKCCATNSGYIAYDWKKKGRTGNVWYYDDCDEGVLYIKGGNEVISKQTDVPVDSGANRYSFCGKGNVVTSNGRCIPCAGAANLSGVTVDLGSTRNCHIVCSEDEVAFTGASGAPGCCPGTVKDGVCHQELLKMGVRVNNACLIDGQCGLNIYRILGIRASDNYNPSVSNVASDVINAAISIMGTIVTIVFVVAGIVCSMNSISGKDTKKVMKVFVDSAVGMLMVWGSYAIIRLIQFIATAGS